jgi:BolA protein
MNTPADTLTLMRLRLAALDPRKLDIHDDSALHAGHEGAKGGGGHYRVIMVSPRFKGLGLPARHRLVYDALRPLMGSSIHALAIQASAPEEV